MFNYLHYLLDFSWLHHVVDKLRSAGIGVVMGTPTAVPPVWLTKKYPDMLVEYAPITLVASFKEAPAEEALSQNGDAGTIGNQNVKSSNMMHILLAVIGLVVIATETGIIIYKKRSKK